MKNKVIRKSLRRILYLIIISTLFHPIKAENNTFVDKLPKIISKHLGMRMGIPYRGHEEPCIVKFEKNANLGILSITYDSHKCVYNYVRYDTLGNMILDLRNFKTTPPITGAILEGSMLTIPCADYIIDGDNNMWLFYIDATDAYHRYVAWVKVDSTGKIIEDESPRKWITGLFFALLSTKHYWHLFLDTGGKSIYEGLRYVNTDIKEPRKINIGIPIELANGNILLVDVYKLRKPFRLEYSIINDEGETLFATDKGILLDSCAFYKIENHGMDFNKDVFHYNDSILVAISIWTPWDPEGARINTFYFVKFDKNGKLVLPKDGVKTGKILSVEEMPEYIKPSVVLTAYHDIDRLAIAIDRLAYYGCDGEGNLYLKKWSKEDIYQRDHLNE